MSDSRKSSASREDAQKHDSKYKPAEDDVEDEEEEKDSLFSEQEERKCF